MTDNTNINLYEAVESALVRGDLSKLSEAERLNYYNSVCKSLDLNPLTKPFDYISLSGKLVLYARKDATDQLRAKRGVSINKLERETLSGVYVVTAYATDKAGRSDSSIGAVNIENIKGDALANAMMKAETKAKRRVTLSICGLGMLDETETETIHIEPMPVKPRELTNGSERPYTAEILREKLAARIATFSGKFATGGEKFAVKTGLELCFSVDQENCRQQVTGYLVGKTSMDDMVDPELLGLKAWLNAHQDKDGLWHVDSVSAAEARAVLGQAQIDAGQQTMELGG